MACYGSYDHLTGFADVVEASGSDRAKTRIFRWNLLSLLFARQRLRILMDRQEIWDEKSKEPYLTAYILGPAVSIHFCPVPRCLMLKYTQIIWCFCLLFTSPSERPYFE